MKNVGFIIGKILLKVNHYKRESRKCYCINFIEIDIYFNTKTFSVREKCYLNTRG